MENKTDFKDVAHLYSGALMQTQMGVFPLITRHAGSWMLDTISYGANAVEDDIKPILRPFSDMTDEERIELSEIYGLFGVEHMLTALKRGAKYVVDIHVSFEGVRYLLSKHFDVFGLIESGKAINATTLTPNPYAPKIKGEQPSNLCAFTS